MTSEIQVLRWDKHKNCGEVKPVKIIDLSCTGMVLYIIMWQKIGTVILLYNRKVMTIPNEIFILNDPPYIDNYKQNISVVICDTNYPLWWWWFKSNSCLAPRTLTMNIVTPYIQCLCRRVVPSLQSDIGPTSVNGRLWRWFDVECQRWPVVILLIGSTLQCLISNGFPTNIQRSNTVHWSATHLLRRYVWSLGRRQISIIQHLSCITTKQTITLFVTFSVHTNVRVY